MNKSTEYSLIQLAIKTPRITVDLKSRGLLAKHFKKEKLGKAFNLIYNTFTALGSVPTAEELARFDVTIEHEEVPHTPEHLANNIIKAHNKQIMANIMSDAMDKLVDEEGGSDAAKLSLLKEIKNLVTLNDDKKYSDALDVADDIWQQYIQRAEWFATGKKGIPLGLDILDKHIKGLGKGWMVTVSARNGVGKSWFLANAVLQAWKQGRTIAAFSCEMTSNEFLQRMICIDGSVNPTRFRDGECNMEEIQRFKDSAKRAEEQYGNLYIGNNPLNFETMEEIIREINEKNPDRPIEAIYIDAVYRLQMDGEKEDVRQKRIAVACKTLAQKFDVPVVITTQMNREFGKMNAGKKQVQGGNFTIAGSDAFNTESDLILLLNKNEEAYSAFHYVDMILEKFRHGQDGLNYMIEMNLNIPNLKQVDYSFAKSRMNFDTEPAASKTGNMLIQTSKQIFNQASPYQMQDVMGDSTMNANIETDIEV